MEKQFAGVKLRGYTLAGSEGVKQPAVVEYKNICLGYDEHKSIEAKKHWMLKEKERKRSYKEVKKVKKKQKKKRKKKESGSSKSSKKKRKRKMKQRAKKPRKKRRVLGEVRPKNAAVEIVKIKPRDEAEFIVPREEKSNNKENKEPKLRGGQIAFRNPKMRTMNLLEALEE